MVFGSLLRAWRRRTIRRGVAALSRATVGDVMSKYLLSIRPDTTVIATATKMIAEDVSAFLVVDEKGLQGIVTERDILLKVPLDKDVFGMTVSKIMTPNVVTVPPAMTLVDGVKLMKEKNFRRLIVADNGRPLGIVTQTDLKKFALKHLTAYPVTPAFALAAIMQKDVLVATPKESFAQAREKMRKRNEGAILIVDHLAKPRTVQGIFTEYDVVMQFYEQRGKLALKELDAFMRKYVRAMRPEANVVEALAFLQEKRMRRTPVAEGDQVTGMVAETDLIRFVYPALPQLLAEAEKPDVVLKAFNRHTEFRGEFHGDHLKVYTV